MWSWRAGLCAAIFTIERLNSRTDWHWLMLTSASCFCVIVILATNKRRFGATAIYGLHLLLPLLAVSLIFLLKLSLVSPSPPVQNGTICTLTGEVTSVTENRAGESVIIHVISVSLPGAPPVKRRTSFLAEALLRKNAETVIANSRIVMTGFFAQPPARSATGTPVRAILLSKGIQVEFAGTVGSDVPAHNAILSARLALPQRLVRLTHLSASDCNLLISLLFGGTEVGTSERTIFLRAGLLHLLAASGANVLLVSRCFMVVWGPICRRLPASRWLRLGGELCVTWAFVAMCGSQSSIVRAGCMSTYRAVGPTLGRTSRPVDGLLVAACVMAMWQPVVWQQPGTWLSYAATYAVSLAVQPRAQNRRRQSVHSRSSAMLKGLRRAVCAVWHALRMTMVIELLTLPFVLHWFGQLSTVSVVANVLAEPVMLCLLPIILVLVLLAALPHTPVAVLAASGLGHAAASLLHLLLSGAGWLGRWRWAYLTLPSFTWMDVSAWYVALLFLYQYHRALNRPVQSVIIER